MSSSCPLFDNDPTSYDLNLQIQLWCTCKLISTDRHTVSCSCNCQTLNSTTGTTLETLRPHILMQHAQLKITICDGGPGIITIHRNKIITISTFRS